MLYIVNVFSILHQVVILACTPVLKCKGYWSLVGVVGLLEVGSPTLFPYFQIQNLTGMYTSIFW